MLSIFGVIMRRKIGSTNIIGVIAIICIIIAAGGTYFFTSYLKQAEIDNLKSNYDSEKNQYETDISGLNSQITDLEEILNEDNQDYIKNMVNGLRDYSNGDSYYAQSVAYETEASDYYDFDSFYTAALYYGYASYDYEWASENYSSAKAYFDVAIQKAPNNKTKQLAETYSSLSEIYTDAFLEYSKAMDDYFSTCSYYDENDYSSGNIYLDMGNEHIEEYNDLIEPAEDLENDLETILENFDLI